MSWSFYWTGTLPWRKGLLEGLSDYRPVFDKDGQDSYSQMDIKYFADIFMNTYRVYEAKLIRPALEDVLLK